MKMSHPHPGTLNRGFVALTWSPDGTRLALTGHEDHSIVAYDTTRRRSYTSIFRGHTEDVLPAVFTPDSRSIISGSFDGSIRLWDAVSGTDHKVLFEGEGSSICAIAVSPCERYVLFSKIGPTPVYSSKFNPQEVTSIHPMLRTKAWAGYSTMHLYDLASHTIITEVNHTHALVALSFSSDCSRVIGSSRDGKIFLWAFSACNHSDPNIGREDAASGALHLLDKFRPQGFGTSGIRVERIRFSADERTVITNDCYAPITSLTHWPLVVQHGAAPRGPSLAGNADSHLHLDYFVSDSWIWRLHCGEEPRRACWLPPVYRYQSGEIQDVNSPEPEYLRHPGGWDCGGGMGRVRY